MSTEPLPPFSEASRIAATPQDLGGAETTASFGILAAIARDNLYWFGTWGFIYTSPWVVTASTERQSAAVLISARRRPFELSVEGETHRARAFAIAPLVRRGLRAIDVGLLSVNVQPDHPAFGGFCNMAPPGVQALERDRFATLDRELLRAYDGCLSHRNAESLFEAILEIAAASVRRPTRPERRSDGLRDVLRSHGDGSLEEIADALGVTYTTASRLFVREMGLPFRAYRHYVMCMRAAELFGGGRTLTDIAQRAGFADSAHLSRSWQRRFGFPPSHLRDRSRVRIFD